MMCTYKYFDYIYMDVQSWFVRDSPKSQSQFIPQMHYHVPPTLDSVCLLSFLVDFYHLLYISDLALRKLYSFFGQTYNIQINLI